MEQAIVFDAAPLDMSTLWFSIILSLVTFFLASSPFLIMYVEIRNRWVIVGGVFSVIVCCCIFPLSFVSVPHSYTITNDAIVLNRYVRDIVIPFDDINEIREIDKFDWSRSTAWNPGVFGYLGIFNSKEYGRFNGYISNWKYLVLITRHHARPFIISPDDPPGFVRACREGLGGR